MNDLPSSLGTQASRLRTTCCETSFLSLSSPISPLPGHRPEPDAGVQALACALYPVKSSIATVCVWLSRSTTVKFPRLKPEVQPHTVMQNAPSGRCATTTRAIVEKPEKAEKAGL